ncbi:serine hydrolase domain-containing protein [Lysobacter panacisoli]|uniref:Serine hydrolase domain-containing protein n=1 Tax=Lysobacter panacisoli TaxID=1255263 RepID=A0ABP9LGU1_9GAMM|nr:serine hydrolase domain-containing protein [Lysobacter panacisoli]
MKSNKKRHSRILARAGAVALLLPLTLGSTAQTPQHSGGPVAAQTTAIGTTAVVRPVNMPPAAPLPTGFDVRQFESMAQQLVAGNRVPGLAMAMVHDGKIISSRGFGITDTSRPQPVDSHTVFRLASLSKSFAGTMTGLLVNDGSLRWDSKLTSYLPSFRLSDSYSSQQLTVADVLSHRVGLTHNAFDRDLEQYVDYHTLTQRLAYAPMKCAPGTCYSYQNVAFSLIGDVVFAATGDFYAQEVQRRIFKPLGMNDASLGLEGIQASPSWARPHVRGRGGWVSLMPKTTYYQVLPAAGVNASASDMAQYLLAHTGHRPDVLPAPLLATLHQPLVDTPSEIRGSSWRRTRLNSAGYALGWRTYDYAGHRVVFHGGAVQGYRGLIAMVPELDFGVALLWNSESSLPSGLLPTILDSALGLPEGQWLDDRIDPTLYADTSEAESPNAPGTHASTASAAPR